MENTGVVSKKVPTGVKIIGVLYCIGAVFAAIGAILFFALGTSPLLGGLALIGVIGQVFMIVVAVISFLVGRGLYKGKRWARIAAIALGVLGILIGLLNFRDASIISLLINILITGYLLFSTQVKEAFKKI